MLTEYLDAAIRRAEYQRLADGTWFGEIPLTPGAWATGGSIEETRSQLRSVLEDWLLIGLRTGEPIPSTDGIDLNVRVA